MDIQDAKSLLSSPKKIVITSHRNPDGDAIGSSLGLYHYLIQLGHFLRDFP
jgi:bifunctional oligoribonuclease and PAP phosphatase NrnA